MKEPLLVSAILFGSDTPFKASQRMSLAVQMRKLRSREQSGS